MTEQDPSTDPAPVPEPLPTELIAADPGLLGDVVERGKHLDSRRYETRERD